MNAKIVIALFAASLAGGAWAHEGDTGQQKHHKQQKHAKKSASHGEKQRGGLGQTASQSAGGMGAGPEHDMYKGEQLPSRYRSHVYVVDKWREQGLSAPPRGQQWVQAGADYVLVSKSTGKITGTRVEP